MFFLNPTPSTKLFLFILGLIPLFSNAQYLSEKDIDRLDELGVYSTIPLEDLPSYENQFRSILESDKKMRRNKTSAILVGALGVVSSLSGILIMSSDSGNGISNTLMGGGINGIGVIEMGVSLVLFNTSKKRKQERNALLERLKVDLAP
ncbi:hypothetical protein [Sediminicola luteus]|uniref:Uncharacterized protein n=1 Tax=Sediminicola luteus TaxID=319238 RepID=A0A2A4G923_9FLAO|nr:hypothetical protein [Sediminicola luteus]PCE64911.1 hypothetical protein B7P33_07040 [Sediminicola luteus]